MLCPMRPPPITNLSPARGLVRGQNRAHAEHGNQHASDGRTHSQSGA
jgi:hypothetical protein